MRPGPHIVYTLENAICYGEYLITPRTIVDQVTSYALSCVGNTIATNDIIGESLPLYLALAPWWWGGDLGCRGTVHDPYGVSCLFHASDTVLTLL